MTKTHSHNDEAGGGPEPSRGEPVQEFLGAIVKVAGEVSTFDYTDEQWAEIEQSLRYLQPSQAAVETVRRQALDRRVAAYGWFPLTMHDLRTHLRNAARTYLLEVVNGPARRSRISPRLI
jgi:hypothetical protein